MTSLSLIAPAPDRMIRARTSSVPSLSSELTIASAEPCTSALMISGSSETFLSASLAIMSARRAPPVGGAGLLALHAHAVFGEFAGAGFVLDHGEGLAGDRACRRGRGPPPGTEGAGLGQLFAALVQQGADPAPGVAGHDDVAALQGAALDQHGGDGAAPAIELGFDHHAVGGAVRIGLQVEDLGLQRGSPRSGRRGPSSPWRRPAIAWVSPPRLSTTISCCSSSLITRVGSAPGLSILLIATMIGAPAALA